MKDTAEAAHWRWLIGHMADVAQVVLSVVAGVSIVVAVRHDSVGWLVLSATCMALAVGCAYLKGVVLDQ